MNKVSYGGEVWGAIFRFLSGYKKGPSAILLRLQDGKKKTKL